MRCVGIRISGQVQGVSFREAAKRMAISLALAGFIRNESDGTVYAEVEGEEPQIEKFVAWCHEGPEYAKVEEVKTERLPLRDFEGFHIERRL